jgi:hypothetical protein
MNLFASFAVQFFGAFGEHKLMTIILGKYRALAR